jgi:hypothetical protein
MGCMDVDWISLAHKGVKNLKLIRLEHFYLFRELCIIYDR